MKKLLALLLALLMLLGLTACGMEEAVQEFVEQEVENIIQESGIVEEAESLLNDIFEGVEGEELLDMLGDIITTEEPSEAPAEVPSEEPVEAPAETPSEVPAESEDVSGIEKDGWYYSRDEVALYLYTYGELPGNFITKNEARKLGWEGGSVQEYAPGCAIGGDVFGNREGLLPEANGRVYYECDIDTNGKDSRGAKRIVFSDDGLIYYTDDHYESFTLLYGEE